MICPPQPVSTDRPADKTELAGSLGHPLGPLLSPQCLKKHEEGGEWIASQCTHSGHRKDNDNRATCLVTIKSFFFFKGTTGGPQGSVNLTSQVPAQY